MTFLGIDPGRKGALAIVRPTEALVYRFDSETYRRMLMSVAESDCFCVMEHVGAMPGQGVTSMFSFGENFGWIRGVLDSFHIRYELVRPQTWKKALCVTADKQTSIARCKELFPAVRLIPKGCRVEQDGMAEALLLAYYAREFEQWKMT